MSGRDTGVSRWKRSDLSEKVRDRWYARRVTVDRYRDRSIAVCGERREPGISAAKSEGSHSGQKNSIWSRGDRRYSRSAPPVDRQRIVRTGKACRGFTFDLICPVYLASPMNGTVPPAGVNDRPEIGQGFSASGRRTKDDNVGDPMPGSRRQVRNRVLPINLGFFPTASLRAPKQRVRARISSS